GALFATAGDYMRFLRMWLNDGAGENGRVLKPETVAIAARDQLRGMKIRALPSVNRAVTHDAEFFPGQTKSWGFTFMVNDEDAPTGRPAGSIRWGGPRSAGFSPSRRPCTRRCDDSAEGARRVLQRVGAVIARSKRRGDPEP